MPNIDPIVRFWIGVAITIAVGISQGGLSLSHAIPEDTIPYINAWAGIIAFIGSAILTALNGAASTVSSRLQSATGAPLAARLQSIMETSNGLVKKIETTPEIAAATPSDKIVSK